MKSGVFNTVTWATLLVLLATVAGSAFAEDANPKRGRVYFKMVCTVCHMTTAGVAVPPASRTMAEWEAYMDADAHDASGKTDPRVSYYTSQEYRETIKGSNKAAAKFLKLSDEQVLGDVRAFVVSGAKDSDTPASCQ